MSNALDKSLNVLLVNSLPSITSVIFVVIVKLLGVKYKIRDKFTVQI